MITICNLLFCSQELIPFFTLFVPCCGTSRSSRVWTLPGTPEMYPSTIVSGNGFGVFCVVVVGSAELDVSSCCAAVQHHQMFAEEGETFKIHVSYLILRSFCTTPIIEFTTSNVSYIAHLPYILSIQ